MVVCVAFQGVKLTPDGWNGIVLPQLSPCQSAVKRTLMFITLITKSQPLDHIPHQLSPLLVLNLCSQLCDRQVTYRTGAVQVTAGRQEREGEE
jgi:hypothetical protein